ncbi:MAG: zinc ribbon domain-containing protein [Acutalibacteraceae bacterium]
MANCPKCGAHLKLTDWRPTCPHCGINLIYYGMEERLLEDADKAESEHAVFQKKLDRLKASFIGSPLAIVRIVLSVLPIAALMLPLANVSFWGPFFEKDVSVNAITIYNTVSSLDFDALFAYMGSNFFGTTFLFYFISLVAILLTAVLILVSLIMLTMACSKHGNPRNITLNSIMIALAVLSIVSFNIFSKKLTVFFPDVFTGSVGYGAYIFLATLVALLVINIVIAKVGIEVKYKETFVGGIPSDQYFEYIEQGMSIHAIRKMMAEIDANNKVELAMKAKEEADKLEAEAERLSAEAKAAEAAGDPDAGHKTQLAAQAVDAASKKAMEAADLANEAAAALESLKQFNEPGADAEEKETVSADQK